MNTISISNPELQINSDAPQTPSFDGVMKNYNSNVTLNHAKFGKVLAASKTIAKYMVPRTAQYADIYVNKGAHALSANVITDIYNDDTIDGYAKLQLDEVGDNLLSLLPIIIIVALIPFVAVQVTNAFNITLPTEWQGGLKAADIWVTASMLIGGIITISLVSLIIIAVRKFKGNNGSR